MNHVQKFFVYQLLLMFSLFNGGQMLYAEDIPVFDETDEGMSDGEIAGLVAGSVTGLAVGATAIGVGIKQYRDNKKNNKKTADVGLVDAAQSKDVEVKNASTSSDKRASFGSFVEMHNAFAPPTIDVNEVEKVQEEKVVSDSEKSRKILDEAFGKEQQAKELRDQENQQKLDEKKKVYDDARGEWRKADKALQDLQKQLMLYKNASDINPEAKAPILEAAQAERDRLYKVANEKQKVMVVHEQEFKVMQEEIKQGFQAEAKKVDALVEESVKRTSEYKSRAVVVDEQQKVDEQEAKKVQKDLEKKQQALRDAGMELHKANIAVSEASNKLRDVKNANRYINEADEEAKAKAELKEKKAREKFEERRAAVGRAKAHADQLADEVDALEKKVQEIKLRPQAQEAHPVVEPVVFEDRIERVRPSKNPMNAVLKGLSTSNEVKVAAEKRQAIEDARVESKFKAQQDEEARLKKMAQDRRTNKQKKKKTSTESARVKAEKNKKSFTGRVARRIAGH